MLPEMRKCPHHYSLKKEFKKEMVVAAAALYDMQELSSNVVSKNVTKKAETDKG